MWDAQRPLLLAYSIQRLATTSGRNSVKYSAAAKVSGDGLATMDMKLWAWPRVSGSETAVPSAVPLLIEIARLVSIGVASRKEAEALVRQPVEGVFRYEAEAVERILAASGLKPYVIQKFCIHAVNRMLEDGRTTITAEDVEAVREAVRFEGRDDGRSVVADRASA